MHAHKNDPPALAAHARALRDHLVRAGRRRDQHGVYAQTTGSCERVSYRIAFSRHAERVDAEPARQFHFGRIEIITDHAAAVRAK